MATGPPPPRPLAVAAHRQAMMPKTPFPLPPREGSHPGAALVASLSGGLGPISLDQYNAVADQVITPWVLAEGMTQRKRRKYVPELMSSSPNSPRQHGCPLHQHQQEVCGLSTAPTTAYNSLVSTPCVSRVVSPTRTPTPHSAGPYTATTTNVTSVSSASTPSVPSSCTTTTTHVGNQQQQLQQQISLPHQQHQQQPYHQQRRRSSNPVVVPVAVAGGGGGGGGPPFPANGSMDSYPTDDDYYNYSATDVPVSLSYPQQQQQFPPHLPFHHPGGMIPTMMSSPSPSSPIYLQQLQLQQQMQLQLQLQQQQQREREAELQRQQQQEMEEAIEAEWFASRNPALMCFFASREPSMTLEQYVERLMTYCRCSKECFLLAVRYLERLSIAGLPITPRSVHRVYMTCLLLAIKYREDYFYPTSYYAQCGGVPAAELKEMELQAFVRLGFDCGVGDGEFCALLRRHYHIASQQPHRHGQPQLPPQQLQ